MAVTQGKRIPNFEILRTMSMALVILFHILFWGTSNNPEATNLTTFRNGFWLNACLYPFLYVAGSCGVILYVLITGFFISGSTEMRVDRIAKIWFPTAFYSIFFAIIFYAGHTIGTKQLLLSALPIWTEQYWFVTKYIALVLLAPLLSFAVKGLDKKKFQIVLIVLALLTTDITHGIPYGDKFFKDSSFSVASFILIFFIAAYIKKFDVPEKLKKYAGRIAIVCLLIQGIMGIMTNVLSPADSIILEGFGARYNSLSLIPATFIFIWFKEHHFGKGFINKIIISAAPYTFGVYLIHDNQHIRNFLWGSLVNPSTWWQSPYWIILVLAVTVAILVSGTVIDYFRDSLFKVCRIDKLTAYCKKFNVNL